MTAKTYALFSDGNTGCIQVWSCSDQEWTSCQSLVVTTPVFTSEIQYRTLSGDHVTSVCLLTMGVLVIENGLARICLESETKAAASPKPLWTLIADSLPATRKRVYAIRHHETDHVRFWYLDERGAWHAPTRVSSEGSQFCPERQFRISVIPVQAEWRELTPGEALRMFFARSAA